MQALLCVPKEFWENEVEALHRYFDEQVNEDLPPVIMQQLKDLENRVIDLRNSVNAN